MLYIRTVLTAKAAAFIPVKAQKKQVLLQLAGIFRFAAVLVEVFQAQNNLSPVFSYRKPGNQSAEKVSQMHPPAGGRGKPSGRLNFHACTSLVIFFDYIRHNPFCQSRLIQLVYIIILYTNWIALLKREYPLSFLPAPAAEQEY